MRCPAPGVQCSDKNSPPNTDNRTLNTRIVAEARTWIGTRFHHQGRVKKTGAHQGGCDCIGLVLGVAAALDLHSPRTGRKLIESDRADYGREPDGFMFRATLEEHFIPVPVEEIQPGNLVLMRFRDRPQHVGFVSNYGRCSVLGVRCSGDHQAPNTEHRLPITSLGLIHCYAAARGVVEHRLDNVWRERIVAGYGVTISA